MVQEFEGDWKSRKPARRVPGEQIAEIKIFAEHVEARMSAQRLELSGMGARCHPGAQRAALEAVLAELSIRKIGCASVHLHNLTDRTGS